MAISRLFERLRLRGADSSTSYHLLGDESDQFEKGEDTETRSPSLEPHVLSTISSTPKNWIFTFPWLRIVKVFLPSFLHRLPAQAESRPLRPTAWLDGLRGVAALFVVMHHMSLIWFSWEIHNGWADWNDHFIQLPIIRLVISGPANVMIFFVVSGYALSLKPLSLIRKDQHLQMYQALSSSIFRRHSRLFIPAIIICAPAPIIAYFGGYSGGGMPGAAIKPMNPPRFETIWGQFCNYIKTLIVLSDVYSSNRIAWVYSDSLWTLPIEFRSSLVIFTMLLALSRCTTRARVVITSCIALYSFWYFRWGEFLFIGGMLIVELSLRRQRSTCVRGRGVDETEDDVEFKRSRSLLSASLKSRVFRRFCGIAAFLAALFILSMPELGRGAANSYGFKTLVELIPGHFDAIGAADYFWEPMGAIFLVLVIDNASFLQRIFTTPFAQYLGRVSFALYLVHMLILHSLGYWLGKYFLRITGSDSYWEYGTGVGLAAVIVGCVILWAADLGSRLADANAVRFTGWAYGKLCKTAVESQSSDSSSSTVSTASSTTSDKSTGEKENIEGGDKKTNDKQTNGKKNTSG
ncbi:hypothetical protein NUW58_g6254 [Xylaria curta]|uniref:Uncharacterized protein n=1 Tax=Xylaria curta TaxID=42375 RepID=A0ACC1NVM3_9PEZI|nr:hypothetical protein NUW58_g6254 [Xylaria curta]